MGSTANNPGEDVENVRPTAALAGATATTESPEGHSLTYQLILRHLAKFRDGATALLDLFAVHTSSAEAAPAAPADPGAAAPTIPGPAEPAPKTALELRIESHMSRVDQALRQIPRA